MNTEMQIEILPAPASLPAIITASGPAAPERFLEFFAANIRNPNTRRAYARQVMQFLTWCEGRSVTSLRDVRPLHVAGYIETMPAQAQTVKQALAAIRMLFDWLVCQFRDYLAYNLVQYLAHFLSPISQEEGFCLDERPGYSIQPRSDRRASA